MMPFCIISTSLSPPCDGCLRAAFFQLFMKTIGECFELQSPNWWNLSLWLFSECNFQVVPMSSISRTQGPCLPPSLKKLGTALGEGKQLIDSFVRTGERKFLHFSPTLCEAVLKLLKEQNMYQENCT